MNSVSDPTNKPGMAETAAAIHVISKPSDDWYAPVIWKQSILFKAAAILLTASIISGVLSFLYARHMIRVTEKDFLTGSYYILTFGGSFWFLGRLDAKRASMLIANVILFQTWNTLFLQKPRVEIFILVIHLWLPFYWIWTDPEVMKKMGLVKKGIPVFLFTGLVMSIALVSYLAWGMSNFGFSLKVEPWRLIINSAQVFGMYLAIFCLFYTVWHKLKLTGMSPMSILVSLAFLSLVMNAPVFTLVALGTRTPLSVAMAGLAAITGIMALVTHLTFEKFRSTVPAACAFTAMSALLLMSGLV